VASAIAIILSIITIILLSIFLIRFKIFFSTDKIIEKTKNQMNRMIADINNNANRDINLIKESSNRLRGLLNESERKMEQFREASQILRDMIAETERLANDSRTGVRKNIIYENKVLEGINPIGNKKKSVEVNPDAVYEVKNPLQGTLFDDDEPKSILKDETTVTPDGAAYKQVPLIITKIYDDEADKQIKPSQRDFSDQVRNLFNKGYQVDQIAKQLSCSEIEVQLIIDMDL